MKLITFFLVVITTGLYATETHSQVSKVNIDRQDISIKDVLTEIERQADYLFIYNPNDVSSERKVSLRVKDMEVTEVLNRIFHDTEIYYAVEGSNIMLMKRPDVQQQVRKTITGTVIDAVGEPLAGATLIEKGAASSNGTVADVNGKFSLNVSGNTTLQVSYIGYITQEISVSAESKPLIITLVEDAQALDEVVVVGYGTQKKATLTGAVVSVDAKGLVATKSTNVQNMLTGKLPGVRVIQKTSEPGNFTNQFDIRGLGSPLLIVDGVPRGDLPRMDANDIESISILKDASAAVYGVQAANGVILVTTKNGEKGKAKINYYMYYGIQTPAEILEPVGSFERATLFNELTMRSTENPRLNYPESYFEELARGERPNTDWYGLVMRATAPQQQHNVSISGGSDKVDYYVNFGYTDQGSFFKSNSANYNRYNLRATLNAQITKDLKAGVKLNMIMDETNRQNVATTEIFKTLWRSKPDDPLYANDISPYYYHPNDIQNVVTQIYPELNGFDTKNKNIFQSNLFLQYNVPFIKGLSAKAMFSFDKTYDDNSNFRKEYDEYRHIASNDTYQTYRINSKTSLNRSYGTVVSRLLQTSLNYKRSFLDAHNVDALLLYEERYRYDYNFNAQREFEIPVPYLFAGNSTNQQGNGSGLNEYAAKALVGKLNYDYLNKYLFEFSFRYDGSSKFPKNKQWGFFPSVSLGWRLSEESFIKDNLSLVKNLKLRASYGILGDDGAANFQFVEGFNYPAAHNRTRIPGGYVFGSTYTNALGFRNAPNPDITWFTAKMLNAGLDADLWNGLFGFSVDFFQRDRDGLLDTPSVIVPGTFGAGISQANLNADRTKGFEVELRHHHRVGELRYGITGFVSVTRTMLTKKVQPDRSNSRDYWRNNQVGRYTDIWFGAGAAGHYTSYEEIAGSFYANNGTLPGDPIYEDWNGDGVIDGEDDYPIATTTNPGETWNNQRNYPLMNFGSSINLDYKGFDLNILLQGSAMSYISYSEQLLNPLAWDGNALGMLLDRWHPVDPNKDPYDPTNEWVSGYYPYGRTRPSDRSEFNAQDGTYLRLKSAEIGYTVPVQKTYINKIGVNSLRVYVNVYNLLTFTKVRGVDPEKPSEMNGYLYPLNRTFNFGGSITF